MRAFFQSWSFVLSVAVLAGSGLGAVCRDHTLEQDALRLSHSDSFKVRLAAIRQLGGREDHESRRRLEAMLGDPHPLVREVAKHTLARMTVDSIACQPVGLLTRP